jgi:acetyltransferase-like isoleucine patch superfamily enzyme
MYKLFINPYLIKRKAIKFLNLIVLAPFFKKYGKGSRIESAYYLTPKYIELGKHVLISKNARIEGVNCYEGVKHNPLIILEDNVAIQQNIHLTCAKSIIIKCNTAIAANVTITDIIHPYEDIETPIERQKIRTKTVEIGADSKIYNNAVILPGVILGKHCVVGANSVVLAGNYPDYSIIVGSPAKIVNQYANEKWNKI